MPVDYLTRRVFAGQVARAGESGIVALAYVNKDSEKIPFGVFVCAKDNGCAKITKATDQILGVSLKLGSKNENKPGQVMSVLALPHGTEIWVQGKSAHGLDIGDDVGIEATAGDDAGKVAKTPTLALTAAKGKFYVTGVEGDFIKIMRKEA
ncbi:hypothetical protein [Campylobacter sp.]|uniref:structural cement protein Gp24 n=1 Tax=Campylobacter sp. TaxID=205 RepID=UPI00290FBC0C|nr:hypothetical protein [Campylobacter sp.]MDU6827763.1 hypothetical protein [Campylobacter sp.]